MNRTPRGAFVVLILAALCAGLFSSAAPRPAIVQAHDLTLLPPPDTPWPSATPEHTATAEPFITETPTTEITPTETGEPTSSPAPSETPSPTASATDLATTILELTPTPTPTATPPALLGPPPEPQSPASPFESSQFRPQASTALILNQVYGGGGNSGAPYQNDFVELRNVGATSVDVSNWSVQYASATGSAWSITPLSGTVAPGQYFLVRLAGGANGLPLPTPDITGTTNLSATAGKVALVNTTTALTGACPALVSIVDFVGYGSAANCSETSPTGNLSNTKAAIRLGPVDTDNNAADFGVAAPNPRNSLTTPTPPPTLTPTLAPYPSLAVMVNEVAWAGTAASSSDEWIELYNPGPVSVNLSQWLLTDEGDLEVTFPAGLIIPANGFLLLERTDDSTVSDMAADLIYTGGLSNEGETLTLRDALGNVVDTANADGSTWPAGSADAYASMERLAVAPDAASNWRTHAGAQNGLDADGNPIRGTPRGINSAYLPTPTPQPFPAGILLNEFLPSPSGGAPEFIELINLGTAPVNLSGWKLDDGEGGSSPFTIPAGTFIQPGQLLTFDAPVALNNDGDSARLLYPDGRVADEHTYERDPGEDTSWVRLPDGGAWRDNGDPSPGQPNRERAGRGPAVSMTSAVPIGVFRTWPAGAWATLTGRVTLPAPLFGKRLIYIQDETGGIAVYLGRGDWPALLVGQRVTVLGYSRLRSNGRLELYVRNPFLVAVEAPDGGGVAAWVDAPVSQATAGRLVTVTGRVFRLETQAFWIETRNGPVRVFFASSTGVRRPKMQRGEVWSATGLVTEMSATSTRTAGWQVQPRFAGDVPPVSGRAGPSPADESAPLAPTPTEEPTATAVP